MNVQDKLERILREMHIMISKGPTIEDEGEFVLVHKRDMQRLLGGISQAVSEMMEQYEVTAESRNKAELEAEKHRMEIVRNANRQAEDIYAASVLYTDDALGRIQDIIDEAQKSAKEVLTRLNKEMEEEKRLVRSNQLELKTQLEDMKDTTKYMKLIDERNREIAKAKAKKAEEGKPRKYERKVEKDPDFVPITPEIKINEEYFEKAGLTPDGLPKDMEESTEEKTTYEKPVIKINEEYFKKAGIPIEKEETEEEKEAAQEEKKAESKAENKAAVPKTALQTLEEKKRAKKTNKGNEAAEEKHTDRKSSNEEAVELQEIAVEEFAEELTPEMEAKLMEELDKEYFEWSEEKPLEENKKEKRGGLFSFGKKS